MNKTIVRAAAIATLAMLIAVTAYAVDRSQYSRKSTVLKNEYDRASYSIGMSLGQDFKMRELAMNPDLIAMGVRDMLEGNTPLLSQEEAADSLKQLQAMVIGKQQEAMAKLASKNKSEGEAFLAENGKREGVVTTESGLQYEILEEGSGATPTGSDNVSVDYRGTFIDGTEFDSSYKRGEPIEFSVDGIIPGWTEALQMMKEGAKWRLYIPSSLAYGEQGAAPVIGPNSTLVFDVELHKILK